MADHSNSLGILHGLAQPVDWEQVFSSELPRVYNFFLYKTGNRENAQDLTAATFERAWKYRARYRILAASPATWLFGIARNMLKEFLRSSRTIDRWTEPLSSGDRMPRTDEVEQDIQHQHDKERLRGLLLELPEREQEIIALKYGAGLTNREIARVTKISESNVGSILHRTVKSLRKRWEDDHG